VQPGYLVVFGNVNFWYFPDPILTQYIGCRTCIANLKKQQFILTWFLGSYWTGLNSTKHNSLWRIIKLLRHNRGERLVGSSLAIFKCPKDNQENKISSWWSYTEEELRDESMITVEPLPVNKREGDKWIVNTSNFGNQSFLNESRKGRIRHGCFSNHSNGKNDASRSRAAIPTKTRRHVSDYFCYPRKCYDVIL